MIEKIKNIQELKQELLRISQTDECRNTRIMALALAYILNELCPSNRSTKHVTNRAYGNGD